MIDLDTIRDGLAQGEFFLEYLPTVTLADGRCVGAEALARWRRPSGVLQPDEFLHLIEGTHLSGMLTYWAFETVAKVVWCHPRADGFETGVEFSRSDQAYGMRMCEQVCHIEKYRAEVKAAEGRELTPEEAAVEWVGKFADKFPRST